MIRLVQSIQERARRGVHHVHRRGPSSEVVAVHTELKVHLSHSVPAAPCAAIPLFKPLENKTPGKKQGFLKNYVFQGVLQKPLENRGF